jgi:hypothetical protein
VTDGYEGKPADPGGPVDRVVGTEPVDEVDRPAWFTLMAPGWWPPDGSVTQAYGLCFDPGARVVLVQLDDRFWTLPGGRWSRARPRWTRWCGRWRRRRAPG